MHHFRPQSQSRTVGADDAVGDRNPFTGTGVRHGLENNGIIPTGQIAVTDPDILTAIQIQTVCVGAI